MDYIREFDIKLEKEYYYPGEAVNGNVILDTVENFKLRSKFMLLFSSFCRFIIILSSSYQNTIKG